MTSSVACDGLHAVPPKHMASESAVCIVRSPSWLLSTRHLAVSVHDHAHHAQRGPRLINGDHVPCMQDCDCGHTGQMACITCDRQCETVKPEAGDEAQAGLATWHGPVLAADIRTWARAIAPADMTVISARGPCSRTKPAVRRGCRSSRLPAAGVSCRCCRWPRGCAWWSCCHGASWCAASASACWLLSSATV